MATDVYAFNEAMLDIYRRAKSEAKYNAKIFLQLVVDRGGLEAARYLIHSDKISDGFINLLEKKRIDLTVEAMIIDNSRWHALFTFEELQICRSRLRTYQYTPKN